MCFNVLEFVCFVSRRYLEPDCWMLRFDLLVVCLLREVYYLCFWF